MKKNVKVIMGIVIAICAVAVIVTCHMREITKEVKLTTNNIRVDFVDKTGRYVVVFNDKEMTDIELINIDDIYSVWQVGNIRYFNTIDCSNNHRPTTYKLDTSMKTGNVFFVKCSYYYG